MTVGIVMASFKVFLSLRRFGRPAPDDYLLLLAAAAATVGTTMNIYYRNALYTAPYIQMGAVPIDYLLGIDIEQTTIAFCRIETASNISSWTAIFLVKFAYLTFFRKLISRVKAMRIWWIAVCAFTLPCGLVNTLLGMYACPLADVPNFQRTFPRPGRGTIRWRVIWAGLASRRRRPGRSGI